jgi:hypothetical protein
MIIFLPVFFLILSSITLVLIKLFRSEFRFSWFIAIVGAFFALCSVIFWQLKLPQTFTTSTLQTGTIFQYTPTWLADKNSWPYALSLTTLALAVIATSVIRKNSNSWNWAGILFITSIGVLAVSSDNPLTLVIAWVALDLTELFTLLRLVKAEKSEDLVVAFTLRLGGVFLLLWASVIAVSSGLPMDFSAIPARSGILIILAAGLQLGIFPLHLPIHELDFRRGVLTILRLSSVASGLALLARIPPNSIPTQWIPYLLIFTGLFALIGAFIWLISSDELTGRPFWILSLGSLALSATLSGNSTASIAWGITLILSGGILFLNSGRHKRNNWIPVIGIWSLTALPFSLTATAWLNWRDMAYLLFPTYLPIPSF